MHFSSDVETASQDILLKVGQEAASKYGEKGAKSKVNLSFGFEAVGTLRDK